MSTGSKLRTASDGRVLSIASHVPAPAGKVPRARSPSSKSKGTGPVKTGKGLRLHEGIPGVTQTPVAEGKPFVETKDQVTAKPGAKRRAQTEATVSRRTPESLKVIDATLPHPVPTPAVAIYQIHFEPSQRADLDPAFIPYDNSASQDPLLEFAVFERLARDEGVRLAPLWGAVSWRFGRKTGLSGKAVIEEIERHPGFDLYFCNPEPENEGLYANQWHRGITAHPGFRELCTAVFRTAGLDPAHLDAVTPSQMTSSCNYFVGTAAFWSAYLPFVRGIVDRARAGLPPDVLALLDSSKGDPRSLHGGASYWPFIVERLLPLFLRGPGQSLKVHKIPLSAAEARLNSHIKRLREMKDVAHRTRSAWLHSCWVHYRNLFLLQAAGKEWCKENLVRITPREVLFL